MRPYAKRPIRNKRFFRWRKLIDGFSRSWRTRGKVVVESQRKNPRRKPIEIFIAGEEEFLRLQPSLSYCIPASRFETSHFSLSLSPPPVKIAFRQFPAGERMRSDKQRPIARLERDFRVFILEIDKGRQRCHNQKDRSNARGQRAAEKKKKKGKREKGKKRRKKEGNKEKTKQFAGKRPITSAHASKRCVFRERLYRKKKRRNFIKTELYDRIDPRNRPSSSLASSFRSEFEGR